MSYSEIYNLCVNQEGGNSGQITEFFKENSQFDINQVKSGYTLLSSCCKKNSNSKIIDLLLKNKADPNIQDETKEGHYPLHHIVINQYHTKEVIELLKFYGADLNAKNNMKVTALYYSTCNDWNEQFTDSMGEFEFPKCHSKIVDIPGGIPVDIPVHKDFETKKKMTSYLVENGATF